MHAASMHIDSLVPGTTPAANLPQNIIAVNAREIRFGCWPRSPKIAPDRVMLSSTFRVVADLTVTREPSGMVHVD